MGSPRLLVIAGDVVAISLFGLIGLVSHERAITGASFARSVLPFVAAWLAVGVPLGVAGSSLGLRRMAGVWLLAGVAALAARSLVFDRPLFSAFLAIGLLGNGLFIMLWRLLYRVGTGRRAVEERSPVRTLESKGGHLR